MSYKLKVQEAMMNVVINDMQDALANEGKQYITAYEADELFKGTYEAWLLLQLNQMIGHLVNLEPDFILGEVGNIKVYASYGYHRYKALESNVESLKFYQISEREWSLANVAADIAMNIRISPTLSDV